MVAPNPVINTMTLSFSSGQDQDMTISVSNMSGQEFMNLKKRITTGMNTVEISTGDLANGIYFLNASVDNHLYHQKVVILH